MLKKLLITSALIAAAAQCASAAVLYLRENNSSFQSNAVTTTPFDDAGITVVDGTGNTTNTGGATNLSLRVATTGIVDSALFATKNLFTVLPKTSGTDTINITSAKLHIYANNFGSFPGDANASLTVNRVTTNWLLSAAGSSEASVSGKYTQNSTLTTWTNAAGFGAGDISATGSTSITYNNAANGLNSLDITAIVQAMYATETNFGVLVTTSSASQISIRTSEQNSNITPVFEITYDYVPEPASLSAIALAGMVGLRRRRA